jgi:hypothetical protein
VLANERAMIKFDITPLYCTLQDAKGNFRQFDRRQIAMRKSEKKIKERSYMNYIKFNHETMTGQSIPDDCLSAEELRVRNATERKLIDLAKQKALE